MDINFFDLSGGIHQSTTKTELGLNPRKIYWSDSKNVELYQNKGIIRQLGNTLFLELPQADAVLKMCEIEGNGEFKLVIITDSGKIYIYSEKDDSLELLNKTITGQQPIIVPFLKGVIVSSESDTMFYIKNNSNYDVVEISAYDLSAEPLIPDYITVHKGRVWCSKDSTIYYSALGSYSDFDTENDAGYINDFHTDTADIVTMHSYKDYMA